MREKGLPFENGVLCERKYVLAFWNVLMTNETLSRLMYTGQFFNKLTVISYGFTYSKKSVQRVCTGQKRKAFSQTNECVVRKIPCVDV